MWFAREQAIEIVAQAVQRFAYIGQGGSSVGARVAFQRLQQVFEGFGEFGDAAQADDIKCAMHLVNVGAAELELGDFAIFFKFIEGSASALQGLIDFTLDPGERADVEFCCCAHVRPQSTLKPATEPFSSEARPDSSSTASAVRCVPAVVCSVTRRMSCIRRATWVAELACS